ncbi:MAG: hypothetical protein Q8P22_11935, partial [Chloroflexota bacterium]|nr:hypothetical protein [Chloroflexota bacterium]
AWGSSDSADIHPDHSLMVINQIECLSIRRVQGNLGSLLGVWGYPPDMISTPFLARKGYRTQSTPMKRRSPW